MPKITFLPNNITIDAHPGEAITEAAKRAGIIIPKSCGGVGACSSCKVTIQEGSPREITEIEEMWGLPEGQRLGCQCQVGSSDLTITIGV